MEISTPTGDLLETYLAPSLVLAADRRMTALLGATVRGEDAASPCLSVGNLDKVDAATHNAEAMIVLVELRHVCQQIARVTHCRPPAARFTSHRSSDLASPTLAADPVEVSIKSVRVGRQHGEPPIGNVAAVEITRRPGGRHADIWV